MNGERAFPDHLLQQELHDLPTSFAQVTSELLTRLLQQAAPGVIVRSVDISAISEGTGSRARLTLRYDAAGDAAGLPRTMWLKSWFNDLREMHHAMGSIIGEIIFYRFARHLPIRSAAVYYAGYDAKGQGLILMEDLGARDARFLGAATPLTYEQARDGVDQLARLHSACWNIGRPKQGALWPELPNAGLLGTVLLEQVIPAQDMALRQDHLKGRIPDALLVEGLFADAMRRCLDLLSQPPFCLLHYDPHLGNVALDEEGRVILMDWQFFRIGNWAHDVSYFIASALRPEDRRIWEKDLLAYYLAQLASHGAEPPSFRDAWKAYVAGQLYGVLAWANTHLEMQTMDTIQMFLARHVEAVTDLGTIAVLLDDDAVVKI